MKYQMKEYETFKVYGKKLNVWKQTEKLSSGREYDRTIQVELAYKTFDFNGEIVGEGSEDFSIAREDSSLTYYEIWTWDGEKVNRGGYRWFECRRRVRINRSDLKKLKSVAAKWYPDAAVIDVRNR